MWNYIILICLNYPTITIIIIVFINGLFYLDDESKSIGSNEDSTSLNRFNESKDQILILEKQYKASINESETKIADLIRWVKLYIVINLHILYINRLNYFIFLSENELLKHQLRKYVSAVQLMKQDENESEEAKLYQQKLIQVCTFITYLCAYYNCLNFDNYWFLR